MLSLKAYFIIVTTVSVLNGKTIDKIETPEMKMFSDYSSCNSVIKDRKKSYYNSKKEAKKNSKNYTYKTIKCSKKTIEDSTDFIKLIKF